VVEKGSTQCKKGKTMKTVKASKEIRSIDLANDELVAGLVSTLNESAQVAWFEKAVSMLNNELISVRGLKATIEKASDSTWLKASHVPYFKVAHHLRAKSGGDKVALKKVITTVQDAKRAFKKAEDFANAFEKATTFKAFVDSIPARASKARGAGKETSAEKVLANLNADEIIERTLISLGELDNPYIANTTMAEALIKGLKALVNSSKSPNHPANRAKVSA